MRPLPTLPGIHERVLDLPELPPLRVTFSIPAPVAGSPAVRPPLVLCLHYAGHVTPWFGRDLLEGLVAPALCAMAPLGIAPDLLGGEWTSPENESAVASLLEAVLASGVADPARVSVTGYSLGGRGAWHLAGRFPGRFAAAIPMAGPPPAAAGEFRTPVRALHSRSDELVPFGPVERRIAELRARDLDAALVEVEGAGHYDVGAFLPALRGCLPWLRGRSLARP